MKNKKSGEEILSSLKVYDNHEYGRLISHTDAVACIDHYLQGQEVLGPEPNPALLTCEEFFRAKVKKINPQKEHITLSFEQITVQQAMRWAYEFATYLRINNPKAFSSADYLTFSKQTIKDWEAMQNPSKNEKYELLFFCEGNAMQMSGYYINGEAFTYEDEPMWDAMNCQYPTHVLHEQKSTI